MLISFLSHSRGSRDQGRKSSAKTLSSIVQKDFLVLLAQVFQKAAQRFLKTFMTSNKGQFNLNKIRLNQIVTVSFKKVLQEKTVSTMFSSSSRGSS